MSAVKRMAVAFALVLGAVLAVDGAAGLAGGGKSFCAGFQPGTRALCRGILA